MVSVSEFLVSLKQTIQNLGTVSLIAILAIIVFLIILMVIEKRLEKKMVVKKDKNSIYLEQVSTINGKNPEETLKKIDSLAREFLKEGFQIKKSTGYSELKGIFSKQKNKKISDFCSRMNDFLYSGKEANSSSNQKLVNTLTEIIRENPLPKNAEPPKSEPNSILNKIRNLGGKSENVQVSGVDKKNFNTEK